MKLYGGIEGGASFSKVVLIDENGKVLKFLDGEPSTNIWLIGEDEWADRINAMVNKAVDQTTTLPDNSDRTLQSLGLCLSGCEDETKNEKLIQLLHSKYPKLCHNCTVASDTIGSIMTGSPDGGIVLIAGTGSNSLLVNSDGTSVRCGGWGHMIGDYGSAYWIAQLAVRYLIEIEEKYNPAQYDTTEIKKAIYEHFNIKSNLDLLKPLYECFDKTFFAGLCSRIAKLAIEKNDQLSLKVFEEAGEVLAKHVVALMPNIKHKTEVPIICVGSVFKSWTLLQNSFLKQLGTCSKKVSIRHLTETCAFGAAYFAAKNVGIHIPMKFDNNYQVLCCYQNGQVINCD